MVDALVASAVPAALRAIVLADAHALFEGLGSDVLALDQHTGAQLGLAQQFGCTVETGAELFVLGEDGLAGALVDLVYGRVLHFDHPARTIDPAFIGIFRAQAVFDVVVFIGEVIRRVERDALRCGFFRPGR